MRVKRLDALRGVAILLVLGHHKYLNETWNQIGWISVDLFFVLSGFLVSGLLFKEFKSHGRISPVRFLVRRGFKIYPAFYFLWCVTLFVIVLMRGHTIPSSTLVSELAFVQNYGPSFWPHTWSLAVEEHFYLLLVLSFVALCRSGDDTRNPFDVIPRATLTIGLALLGLRILTRVIVPAYDMRVHYHPTHLRLDSLMFGVCIAYWHHFHHETLTSIVRRWSGVLFAASAAAASLPVFVRYETPFMSTLGYSLLYLGFGGLLMVCLYQDHRLPSWIRFPAAIVASGLAGVGVSSYSIYLWHIAARDWGLWLLHAAYPRPIDYRAEFVVYVAMAVGVGVVMSKLIEQPILRLRDRWFPARSGPAVQATVELVNGRALAGIGS